ncbi:MAG: hypothetical protein J6J36_00565 [Clostridia bacterium]|nr:hypothetical protein [Clostridia bacterium]
MAKKIDRLGETKLNNQDLKMTIIVYRNSSNIDVQFEDGTIAEHKSYDNFKKGKIRHPNYQLKKRINNL